ncbi:MAG TPA: DUF222 domain-containing protein, partial [Streptosporangiaceae bacterium]|nr:DUF222 domain-containing protein [Streptosporangiaceae bacterium]
MSEAASTPGPAAGGDASGPAQRGPWPGEGRPCLSEDDLLALLDGLGVAGTHDPEEDQEAIAEAEWEARQADDFGAGDEDREGRAVSPVLVAEHLPAGPGLAAMLSQDPTGHASDWDLPGLAAGYRRIAAWAQARELDAAAEIAARRAAANPRIGTIGEDGQPASLPPEAAAEIALELAMTQPGASAWTALGCRLRWDLPLTGAALAAGTIDLGRARIIADATAFLTAEQAALVEARVLPAAGGQTTSQLRAAARRAVLAIDPEGAEQRRRDTERSAKVGLYPGEEGTATLTGSCLPGIEAAAAMARITAMARALKSSGAHGGLDLLRANIFLGLLLGTLPLIPPPADGPPDNPPPPDNPSPGDDEPSAGQGRSPVRDDGDSRFSEASGSPASGNSASGSPASGSPASGNADPTPDGGSAAVGGNPEPARSPAPDGNLAPGRHSGAVARDSQGSSANDDSSGPAGWWPDIPPPTDGDGPPDDDGPRDPVTGLTDDIDDDWPQLPPPEWPPLPAHLPEPPGPRPGG